MGETTVWVPEDSDLNERLVARFGEQGRSAAYRDGAELLLAVEEVLDSEGVDIPRGPERRSFVRQAVRNELRRDVE